MNTATLHPRSRSLYSGPSKISDDTQNFTTNVLDSVADKFRLIVDRAGLKLGEGQRVSMVVMTALYSPKEAVKMADEMIARTKSDNERAVLQAIKPIVSELHGIATGTLLALSFFVLQIAGLNDVRKSRSTVGIRACRTVRKNRNDGLEIVEVTFAEVCV